MEIDANVYNLLNVLMQVILWYLIISSPAVLLTIELYLYGKYKKWENTEAKEKEKIIVGKANKIVSLDEEMARQNEDKKKLEFEIDLLRIQKKTLQDEVGISDDNPGSNLKEETDLSKMNIKQLKELAKQRGLKMYSKKNKQQLLKMLQQ